MTICIAQKRTQQHIPLFIFCALVERGKEQQLRGKTKNPGPHTGTGIVFLAEREGFEPSMGF